MRIERDQIHALAAAVVMVGLFIGGVVVPLRYQRAGYAKRVADAERALGLDLKDVSGLAKLNEQVAQLRQVIDGAQQYVPQDDELDEVLRGISEALDAFGITQREMTTSATQGYADYKIIPIKLRFSAAYPATHGVLQRIENMRRLIRIDHFKVAADNDDADPRLSVEMTLSTFIARPVESNGS